jgi:hypothetical protein
MGERRVLEVHYPDFAASLRKATNAGKRIEKADRDAWSAYVRKHNVPEAALASRVKSGTMSGNFSLVIIDGMGSSDGYYGYSSDEAFCLKFESGLE